MNYLIYNSERSSIYYLHFKKNEAYAALADNVLSVKYLQFLNSHIRDRRKNALYIFLGYETINKITSANIQNDSLTAFIPKKKMHS